MPRLTFLLLGILFGFSAIVLAPVSQSGTAAQLLDTASVTDDQSQTWTVTNRSVRTPVGSIWRKLQLMGRDGSILDESSAARDAVVLTMPNQPTHIFLLQDPAGLPPSQVLMISANQFQRVDSPLLLPLGFLLILGVQFGDYLKYASLLLALVFLAREIPRQMTHSHMGVGLALQLALVVLAAVWFIGILSSPLSFTVILMLAGIGLLLLHRVAQPEFWRQLVKQRRIHDTDQMT